MLDSRHWLWANNRGSRKRKRTVENSIIKAMFNNPALTLQGRSAESDYRHVPDVYVVDGSAIDFCWRLSFKAGLLFVTRTYGLYATRQNNDRSLSNGVV